MERGGVAATSESAADAGPPVGVGVVLRGAVFAVVISVTIALSPAWIALPFGIPPVFDRACLFSSDPMSGKDAVGVETLTWSLTPYWACTPVGPLDTGKSGPAFDAAVARLALEGPYEGPADLTPFVIEANSTRPSLIWSAVAVLLTAVWLIPAAAVVLARCDSQRVRRRYRLGGLAAAALGGLYVVAALALRVVTQAML